MARILIIDDSQDILRLLRLILESAGHTVYDAADGVAGMHIFRKERPELVITDIFMPEQDGLATIRMLRHEFPTVKILAISGGGQFGTLNYLDIAETLGADAVLSKPFTSEALLAILQNLGESADLFN